jgi:hypothetical protein
MVKLVATANNVRRDSDIPVPLIDTDTSSRRGARRKASEEIRMWNSPTARHAEQGNRTLNSNGFPPGVRVNRQAARRCPAVMPTAVGIHAGSSGTALPRRHADGDRHPRLCRF